MPSVQQKINPGVLLSKTSASMLGTYGAVGTLLHTARIVKFTNNTNQDVTLSWDGTNDHEYIPAGSFLLLDCASNAIPQSLFNVSNGTIFYAKGTAGTGTFYISYYYGS